jgi:hypothetical protein
MGIVARGTGQDQHHQLECSSEPKARALVVCCDRRERSISFAHAEGSYLVASIRCAIGWRMNRSREGTEHLRAAELPDESDPSLGFSRVARGGIAWPLPPRLDQKRPGRLKSVCRSLQITFESPNRRKPLPLWLKSLVSKNLWRTPYAGKRRQRPGRHAGPKRRMPDAERNARNTILSLAVGV